MIHQPPILIQFPLKQYPYDNSIQKHHTISFIASDISTSAHSTFSYIVTSYQLLSLRFTSCNNAIKAFAQSHHLRPFTCLYHVIFYMILLLITSTSCPRTAVNIVYSYSHDIMKSCKSCNIILHYLLFHL